MASIGTGARCALVAAVLAAPLLAVGCTSIQETHGYVPTRDQLAGIEVGTDTRTTVRDAIGSPSTSAFIRDDTWYYVKDERETYGPFRPRTVSREALAISFAPDDTVRNLERFGLRQGRVIALNRRVSDDNIEGVSFLRQLFGNIGGFRAQDLLDEAP